MKRFIKKCIGSAPWALLLLVLFIFIQIHNCHARRPNSETPLFRLLISNGSNAQFQASPYVCSIRHRATGRHFCGGVLLGPRNVLTAAYCVSPIALNINPEVWCGDIQDINNVSRGAVDAVRAVKTTIHECYDPRRYLHDIAVLELNTSVLHGKPIENIIKVEEFENLKNGDELMGLGWGKTETTLPKVLQQAVLPFIPHPTCNTAEIYNNTVDTGSMFCAGYFGGGSDACAGDSGGPLVQKGHIASTGTSIHGGTAVDSTHSTAVDSTLVGIVSWGLGCASNRSFPGVYARVDIHHDWIALHSHCACTSRFLNTGNLERNGGNRDSNRSRLQSSRIISGDVSECILLEESGEVNSVEHKADASNSYAEPLGLCYVVDFAKCPVATASKVYLGLGWLPCKKNREGEIEPIHNATSCRF
jgi:secreted trypsin-like serine protease